MGDAGGGAASKRQEKARELVSQSQLFLNPGAYHSIPLWNIFNFYYSFLKIDLAC